MCGRSAADPRAHRLHRFLRAPSDLYRVLRDAQRANGAAVDAVDTLSMGLPISKNRWQRVIIGRGNR